MYLIRLNFQQFMIQGWLEHDFLHSKYLPIWCRNRIFYYWQFCAIAYWLNKKKIYIRDILAFSTDLIKMIYRPFHMKFFRINRCHPQNTWFILCRMADMLITINLKAKHKTHNAQLTWIEELKYGKHKA